MTHPRASIEEAAGTPPYWKRSKRPLAILVFLLPFVLVYELSLVIAPPAGAGLELVAYRGIDDVFGNVLQPIIENIFGPSATVWWTTMTIPGILLVLCLLAWHVMARDPWRLEGPTVPLMWIESVLAAVPVMLVGVVLQGFSASILQEGGDAAPADPGVFELASMAVGAGLYEELVFRWILISVVHTLLVDLLKVAEKVAVPVAIAVSSLLFMWAHGPEGAAAHLFYLAAGGWFSVLYLWRGFGIAAGAHIAYDLAWVLGQVSGGST